MVCVCLFVWRSEREREWCVCVCVCERERERERERVLWSKLVLLQSPVLSAPPASSRSSSSFSRCLSAEVPNNIFLLLILFLPCSMSAIMQYRYLCLSHAIV